MIKGEHQGTMMVKVEQVEMEEAADVSVQAVEELCPNGHPLQPVHAFTVGTCDHSGNQIQMGDPIMECSLCNPPYWWCGCPREAEQPDMNPECPSCPPERKVPHTATALKEEAPALKPDFPPCVPEAPPRARRSFYVPVSKEDAKMPEPSRPSKGALSVGKGEGKGEG